MVLKYPGIEIDTRDSFGWTLVHAAARSGSAELIQVLLESGADLSSVTNNKVCLFGFCFFGNCCVFFFWREKVFFSLYLFFPSIFLFPYPHYYRASQLSIISVVGHLKNQNIPLYNNSCAS